MKGEGVEDIIHACCVCPSIKVKNQWINVGKKFYDEYLKLYPLRVSHDFCSPECISVGTQTPLHECYEIYTRRKNGD